MKTLLLKITAVFVMCIFTITTTTTATTVKKSQAPTTVQIATGGAQTIMIPSATVTTQTFDQVGVVVQSTENFAAKDGTMLKKSEAIQPLDIMMVNIVSDKIAYEGLMVNSGVAMKKKAEQTITNTENMACTTASIQGGLIGGENLKVCGNIFATTTIHPEYTVEITTSEIAFATNTCEIAKNMAITDQQKTSNETTMMMQNMEAGLYFNKATTT